MGRGYSETGRVTEKIEGKQRMILDFNMWRAEACGCLGSTR